MLINQIVKVAQEDKIGKITAIDTDGEAVVKFDDGTFGFYTEDELKAV